jgi:histone deacetylase complex regulatory component SIN3
LAAQSDEHIEQETSETAVENTEAIQKEETRTKTPEAETALPLPIAALEPPAETKETLQNSNSVVENAEMNSPEEQNAAMEVTEAEGPVVEPLSSQAVAAPSSERDYLQEDAVPAEEAPQGMRLDINHALQYLDSVKAQFEDRPSVSSYIELVTAQWLTYTFHRPMHVSWIS